MSFSHLQPSSGPFSLGPGSSMRVRVWFGSGGPGQEAGQDKGSAWIMADPVDPTKGKVTTPLPAALEVSEFTKVRDYWAGYVEKENTYYINLAKTVVRYEVTVRNVGKTATRFSVQGGGNT